MNRLHKITTILASAIAILAAASCANNYQEDIDALAQKAEAIDGRIGKLETDISGINESLSQISALAAAVEQNFYITSVNKTAEGYELTMSDGSTISIREGKEGSASSLAPSMGAMQLGGMFFWTTGGVLLTDATGAPVSVSETTPVLKYDPETMRYLISVDGGVTFNDVNAYALVVINNRVLMQVINNYFSRYSTTMIDQKALFQVITTYIQENYKALFNIEILEETVAGYIREKHERIFSYRLLEQIFNQYDFAYYTSQIDVDRFVEIIVNNIQKDDAVFMSSEVLYEIISSYVSINNTSIFTSEMLLEVINNFFTESEVSIDINLLTQVVTNYVDHHRDEVFNTRTVREILMKYVEKHYVNIFREDILVRMLNIYVSQNSTTVINETLIREILNVYIKNNINTVITNDIIGVIVNDYIRTNTSTIFNETILYEVVDNYFQKNYNQHIDRTVFETSIRTYIEKHHTTIISVDIVENIVTNYIKAYYLEIFDIDVLSVLVRNYFEENLTVVMETVRDGIDPVAGVTVVNGTCTITMRDGSTFTLPVYDAYTRLKDRLQSVVVLPQDNGHVKESTKGPSKYLELDYIVSPAYLAQIIATRFANKQLGLTFMVTGGNGDVSTVGVTSINATSDGRITVRSSDYTNNTVKAVALRISDTASGGTDITSEFIAVDSGDGHEWVDLGLPSGLKWATCNVGANAPEEYGDYFAWGETEPYYEPGYAQSESPVWKAGKSAGYDWASYKWCDGSAKTQTKYCTDNSYGIVDNKIVLEPEDDVARVVLGGKWRMPTDEEWTELRTKCTWKWTTQSRVNGMIVTGPNGNSIFLPAAGYRFDTDLFKTEAVGYYWSSSNYLDYPGARFAEFNSNNSGMYGSYHSRGLTIRPVTDEGVRISVSKVTLKESSLTLTEGESATLTATVTPSNATQPAIIWSSNNTSVATVDYTGKVTAVSAGTATITVKTYDGGFTATCAVTVKAKPSAATPTAVDLGLPSGLKWATFNVGANAPEEYGDYFAWGETEPYYMEGHSQDDPCSNWKANKTGYNWASYKWCNGSYSTLTKYNYDSSCGNVDNKNVLDPEDDAAHVNWGGSWRMPTDVEWKELISKCTWTWTTQNGVNGRLVTGPNGNSIFLPAAGGRGGTGIYSTRLDNAGSDGYYWSSSLTDEPFYVYFLSDEVDWCDEDDRFFGLSVRPVAGESIQVSIESLTLDKTSLSMKVGESVALTATVLPSNATNKNVVWTSDNVSVAIVDANGKVAAVNVGNAVITATAGGKSAICKVSVSAASSGHKWVDLGLPSGLKWATCNVGANAPEEYGDYFAWGETEPYYEPGYAQSESPVWKAGKSYGYDLPSYKFALSTVDSYSKYVTDHSYGVVDNKTVLDPEDDAAYVNWGDNWRMPTDSEWTELRTECTWTWTTQKGVSGRKVTGPNGNSIFMPAAGHRSSTDLYNAGSYGDYWSSSLYTDYPYSAYSISFISAGDCWSYHDHYRCNGLLVRPVSE